MNQNNADKIFMGMTLDLARMARGRTSPNPMVGAVIVKNGKVLATGYHRKAGAPHAEIEAMTSPPTPLLAKERGDTVRRPGEVWKGATLYVNLEPCCHHGRTPPCTAAIIASGIREVVIGMKDPDPKVAGSGIRELRRAGLKVRMIRHEETERLNEVYLKHRRTGLPFVTLKIAMTLDGRVAGPSGATRQITGPEACAYVHAMRDEADAILVGKNTILKDDPRLTTRLSAGQGKDPIRIILDSHLGLPASARVFRVKSKAKTYLATVRNKTAKRYPNTEFLVCRPNGKGRIDLKDLLWQLGRRGILSVLVEGGPTVHASFLKEGLADKLALFLAPKVMGKPESGKGVPYAVPPMKNTRARMVGSDVLIEGYF